MKYQLHLLLLSAFIAFRVLFVYPNILFMIVAVIIVMWLHRYQDVSSPANNKTGTFVKDVTWLHSTIHVVGLLCAMFAQAVSFNVFSVFE